MWVALTKRTAVKEHLASLSAFNDVSMSRLLQVSAARRPSLRVAITRGVWLPRRGVMTSETVGTVQTSGIVVSLRPYQPINSF